MKKIALFCTLLGAVACGPPVEDDPNPIVLEDACGDGACDASEDASSCPSDCSAGPSARCGDGTCQASEDAMRCPQDCSTPGPAVCGDALCDMGEDAATCPADCGAACGDGFCDVGEDITCPADCSGFCGDGVCEVPSEDATTCFEDCADTCGDGVCQFIDEDSQTCPADCPVEPMCGDGVCEAPEDASNCLQDCGAPDLCGNGTCDPVESEASCPRDCRPQTRCGDGTCDAGESEDSCPDDCKPVCVKQCAGKFCGPDGCGGMCGTCSGANTCDAAGQCQPPAPVPESYAYEVQHSFSGSHSGAMVSVASGAGSQVSCTYDTATNWLSVTLSDAGHELRMYIESDPIGFCLFNTSDFNTFTYVKRDGAGGFQSWGVDSLGNTSGLALSCQLHNNNMRISGMFSSGRLFLGRNSSAFPGDHVTISGGAFSCDL